MKVILINEKGAYKQHNFKTFDVVNLNGKLEMYDTFAALDIDGNKVDTPLKNILIVDVQQEYEAARKIALQDSTFSYNFNAIKNWANIHNVKL